MSKQKRDAALDTRNARRRLNVQSEPHWRSLDRGLHLGYRKRGNGGSWVVRWFNESKRYVECKLGAADDFQEADGIKLLNYRQAQEAARK